MSTLVNSLSDFIKVLIQAFNFSTIFPSIVFVMLFRLFLVPTLPQNSIRMTIESWDGQVQTGIGILAVAMLSYLLGTANIPIIRWLEGYPWQNWPILCNFTKKKQKYVKDAVELAWRYESTLSGLKQAVEQTTDPEVRRILKKEAADIRDRKYLLLKELHDQFPHNPQRVLPTSFGNIIAAAEEYPNRVLGMDAITLWPFLMPILTERNYTQYMAREKAIMDFQINLALVLIAFGVMLGGISISNHNATWELGFQLTVIACASSLMLSLAVQGAVGWGATLRAAFILFRKDLCLAIGAKTPATYKDEVLLWKKTSDFLRADPVDSLYLQEVGLEIFDHYPYERMSDQVGGGK